MAFNLKDKHIIVTYHYVENPRPDRTGIHPCSLQELEKGIVFLSKHYRLATVEEVYEAAKKKSDERLCAVTFDDGLRSQFENAVPILEKHKAPAIFFIITGIFGGLLPLTHRVHILFSAVKPEEFVERYHHFLENFHGELYKDYCIPLDTYLNNLRRHDEIRVANLKERFVFLPEDVKKGFFDWMFSELRLNKESMRQEFFMGTREVSELEKRGFAVGSHSHEHRALDTLSAGDVEADISKSKSLLCTLLKREPSIFCYPYGRVPKERSYVSSLFWETGFSYAVTTENREIRDTDEPLFIPRYNSNDIKSFSL